MKLLFAMFPAWSALPSKMSWRICASFSGVASGFRWSYGPPAQIVSSLRMRYSRSGRPAIIAPMWPLPIGIMSVQVPGMRRNQTVRGSSGAGAGLGSASPRRMFTLRTGKSGTPPVMGFAALTSQE